MKALQEFESIDDKMYWKGAALDQLGRFRRLAEGLGVEPRAVGSHRSKSIDLPVVELVVGGVRCLLRDNFYSVEMAVQSPQPVTLPIASLFAGILEPHDWAWYLAQIDRARGYSWKFWTDEEMDDPRILRVIVTRENGMRQEWTVTPEVKDRWLKRLTDPEWYGKDWDAPLTYDGAFGPDAVLFVQDHTYCEGISDLIPREDRSAYVPGKSCFAVSLGTYEQAETLIRRISGMTGARS